MRAKRSPARRSRARRATAAAHISEHDAAIGAGAADRHAVDAHLARRRRDETGHAVQQRRLSASGRAERDDEFTAVDLQVDARSACVVGRPRSPG
jgi:hypothetical protein